MPVYREERDAAFDLISYRMIDVLQSWMVNEQRNLEGFLANPEGHVDYSPFLIIDYDSLRQRSGMLSQLAQALQLISAYKQGVEGITRSMHDNAVDHIPVVIWTRLRDWTGKRASDMQKTIEKNRDAPPVPITDYRSAAIFDEESFTQEMEMYQIAKNSLDVTIQFAIEEFTPSEPEQEPSDTGEEESQQ